MKRQSRPDNRAREDNEDPHRTGVRGALALAPDGGSGNIDLPSGDHIEVFEENATKVGFVGEPDRSHEVAERHNRSMAGSIVTHHLHFDLPAGEDKAAQAWCVQRFGGISGIRLRYAAADLPGVNLNFSAVAVAFSTDPWGTYVELTEGLAGR